MRTERLSVVPSGGGAPVELFQERREAGAVTTQDIFQVSPDGAYLAYATGDTVRVRSAGGDERTLGSFHRSTRIRFSPDGKYVAMLAGEVSNTGNDHRVIVLELAGGKPRELVAQSWISDLEWSRAGVVLDTFDFPAQRTRMVYVPLGGGAPVTLFETPDGIRRFVTARTGTRVVAFVREHHDRGLETHVLAFDLATPADRHELAVVREVEVDNADATLDGTRVAYTTSRGLYVIDGDAGPRLVSERRDIHSLWFARDGRLGYASPRIATVLDGKRATQLETGAELRMLRFDPTSAQALVASGDDARAWDTTKKSSRKLDGTTGETVLGVDRFAGGDVLWTTSLRPR